MDPQVVKVVEACSRGSEDNSLNFPEQLAKLADVGVEGYYADLRGSQKIYYLASGESVAIAAHRVSAPIAERFDAAQVEAAVRQSQAGTHTYLEFCEKVARAGCAGYLVSILGRRVVYFGRTAETHLELFPPAR